VRRQALCRRSDLIASLAAYDASQSDLELEIAKQYPDIHLGPGYQYDQGDDRWGLSVAVELPVLNRNQGPIAEAEAARKQAAAAFLALQADVLNEVDRAVKRAAVMGASLRDSRELVVNQSTRLDDVRAAFDAGVADDVEVAAATSELDASRLVELQARADLAHALGELEDAMQTPVELIDEPDCTTTAYWEAEP
jgi:outer membrane protein TolC